MTEPGTDQVNHELFMGAEQSVLPNTAPSLKSLSVRRDGNPQREAGGAFLPHRHPQLPHLRAHAAGEGGLRHRCPHC